ncbi:hypothetical protein ACFU5O_36490 [Streptomyces sp. NPDC057445]|uniref:hypothetical protein n=1 Tax=Streptomyces sp. NPDC057445 TaxID=3346136 RepID=UPI00369A4AAB
MPAGARSGHLRGPGNHEEAVIARRDARLLHSALLALKHQAEDARRTAGLPCSQRDVAKSLSKEPYSIRFRAQAISAWVPDDQAKAQVPLPGSADAVWALVRLWSDWAAVQPLGERYWRDLLERAQAGRIPRPGSGRDSGAEPDDSDTGDLANERRALTAAGADQARDVLLELKSLRLNPNQRHDLQVLFREGPEQAQLSMREEEAGEIWRGEREALVRRLERAALYIADTGLKERLDEVRRVLECWRAPFREAAQQEGRTRFLAVDHALDSIRAFRLGEPLPQPSAAYVQTLDFVDDFIAEWEDSRP